MSQTNFESIDLVSIDGCAANFEIAGTWKGESFHIKIWCEYDGRDVESEILSGECDPMKDWEAEPMFFDVLCQQEKFMKLYNQGYKAWEQMPK